MTHVNPDLDLTLTRVMRAPRQVIWQAWTDPARLEQWWVPAPAKCQVQALDLRPGGAFETLYSEDGEHFGPHVNGCFLDVVEGERLVFTDTLLGGWRPADAPFMTAVISLRDHPEGAEYAAHVMHKSQADRDNHEEMGFYDGWGTVIAQLAALVEQREP
ncbi:MAG: SRPBCC family protein [Chloroflexota bacterium]|nr:SRPBCC family protein [Chloroflexota bacterium]